MRSATRSPTAASWSPASRRRLRSDGRRRLVGVGQLRAICQRAQHGPRRVSPGGNSSPYQWPYLGPAVNPDPNGAADDDAAGDSDGVHVVQRQRRHQPAVQRRRHSRRVVADRRLARFAERERVGGRVSRVSSAGAARCARTSSIATTTDFYATRTDTTTGRVTDPDRRHVRPDAAREHRRRRSRVQGRHVPGHVSIRIARGRRRQLHAVESVGQLRRRELDLRSGDDGAAVVSGVRAGALEQPRG